jgi:light-regulated signal transduction histidine kinase (bacteriophytochrome)
VLSGAQLDKDEKTWLHNYISDTSSARFDTFSFCRINIADNGIGFDPQYTDKIFQIFQRLHGRSEYEGTGIGLAICRRIMENHHGMIRATGQPDQGATFTLVMPVSQKPFIAA